MILVQIMIISYDMFGDVVSWLGVTDIFSIIDFDDRDNPARIMSDEKTDGGYPD